MSSAVCSNLDQSKILLSVKGLKMYAACCQREKIKICTSSLNSDINLNSHTNNKNKSQNCCGHSKWNQIYR